jgi:4-amino-4-deoxy-L-arabinose transferase-like glycosyltransferase
VATTRNKLINKHRMTTSFVLFAIITIFLSLFRLGSFTLFDVDEAVFSEATREMVDSGNWLTPTYNGESRFDKPILFYWIMACSYRLFGINEFGARFPSAIASILLALSLYLFVRRFRDEENALFCGISFVLSLYFVAYSHSAVTDMTLTLFIALSLFSFYLSQAGGKHANAYTYAFYAFSALAFLTKGLVGIVFPFGIAMLYLDITEGWRSIKKIFSIKGILLFISISAPWYIAQFMMNGQSFIDNFFIKHHFRRYFEVISGHSGPFYYFIPVLIIGLFPWIVFLASGVRDALREKERLNLFSLLWLAFIVIFFSLSTTKLPNYILPAVPAASILIASGMSGRDKKWFQYSNLSIAVAVLLTGAALFFARKYLVNSGYAGADWIVVLLALTVAMALSGLYSIRRKKAGYYFLFLLMTAFLVVLLLKALPLANQDMQGVLYKYSMYAKYRLQGDEPLLVYGINKPSLVFYSDRNVIHVRNRDDLTARVKNCSHCIVIVKAGNARMLNASGLRILEKGDKYAILEKEQGQ